MGPAGVARRRSEMAVRKWDLQQAEVVLGPTRQMQKWPLAEGVETSW